MKPYRDRPACHSVYLGSSSYEITVSEEGYRQIVELVQSYTVCHWCRVSYLEDNPNVAGNCCLHCFLRDDHKGLSYQGRLDPGLVPDRYISSYGPYATLAHFFLSKSGNVYITESGPGAKEEATEHMRATARYWHFLVPDDAKLANVRLSGMNFTVYGDLRADTFVLYCFTQYRPDVTVLFLAKRHGPVIEMSKRQNKTRMMLAEAKAEIENTRTVDKYGHPRYSVDGEYQSNIWDRDVYKRLVLRLNEGWKASHALIVQEDGIKQSE